MYVVLLIKVLIVGKQTVLKKASPLTCIVACPDPAPDPAPVPVSDPVPDPVPDPVLDPVLDPVPDPVPEPHCSQMSPSPPCDHRKEALLPPFWGWFEITNPPYVACIEMEQIGETFIPRKKIVVEEHTLINIL